MAAATISEGEVAVYDRQLRLWGAQAQSRLLKSKVLVWGLDGSNIELCKNLVLAGVSLAVRDHRSAEVADVSFNYFLRPEDLGKNRAECASKRVQEMNPLNTVTSVTTGPEEVENIREFREVLKQYDVVCASLGVLGWDIKRARLVDNTCREVGASFMLTLGSGEMAFFFANLNDHTVQERSSAPNGAAAAEEKQPEPEQVHYPSLGEWLDCTPTTMQQKKCDASFILVALFMAFQRGGGRPVAEEAAKFEDFCRNSAKCVPAVDGMASLQDSYRCFFLEPLMHVASIVGGLLAQEVIKAITKRDPPLVNSICFNANTGAALVERLPPMQDDAPKKRKVEAVADILD